uniref:Uncharacterized protein n=1 Tax=Micrurus carvalhoi TaxID=3147026 RepID=A0A2H6N8K5_9SAUR
MKQQMPMTFLPSYRLLLFSSDSLMGSPVNAGRALPHTSPSFLFPPRQTWQSQGHFSVNSQAVPENIHLFSVFFLGQVTGLHVVLDHISVKLSFLNLCKSSKERYLLCACPSLQNLV